MNRFARVLLWTSGGLLAGGVVSALAGQPRLSLWLTSPVLFVSGWAAIGHLVTLDDDAPGGWSNPERSPTVWHSSLRELVVKLCIVAIVGGFVLSQYLRLRMP